MLTALPIALREDAEIGRLLIHLGFILAAQAAPPPEDLAQRIEATPDDLEARYQLASVRLLADDLENAMAELLEIARRDRDFRKDIGRRGLVVLFDMLGITHPLTVQYRPLLVDSLH